MRVLVAEDERISRRLLARSIERAGHEAVAVADGAEAWVRLINEPFDVVASDWRMPEVDGLELCRRVRARQVDDYLYFLLVTGADGHDEYLVGMEAGADDYITKPVDDDTLRAKLRVAQRIVDLQRQLLARERELRRLNEELYRSSRIDALTGVGNRRRMDEDLLALHNRCQRYGSSYCVALCDIDHFKTYNDTCGHSAGDEVLMRVAATLASQCRRSDAVYRYGGEEFLVVLAEQDETAGRFVMNRVRRAVETLALPHVGRPGGGVVTISIGVASLADHAVDTADQLVELADQALYWAKGTGRNAVCTAGEVRPACRASAS